MKRTPKKQSAVFGTRTEPSRRSLATTRSAHAAEWSRRHHALYGHTGTSRTADALWRSATSRIALVSWKSGSTKGVVPRQSCLRALTASTCTESKGALKRGHVAFEGLAETS